MRKSNEDMADAYSKQQEEWAEHARQVDSEYSAKEPQSTSDEMPGLRSRYYTHAKKNADRAAAGERSHSFEWDLLQEILKLEARVNEIEAALRPFAKIEVPFGASDGDWVARTAHCNTQVTAFSVRRARKALAGSEEK